MKRHLNIACVTEHDDDTCTICICATLIPKYKINLKSLAYLKTDQRSASSQVSRDKEH